MSPTRGSARQTELDALDRRIRRCVKCRLCKRRTHAVPGEGPAPVRVMLVGEAPGAREDLEGRPFVGRAGRFLNDILRIAGLSREQVYITNSVKCRPPGNRDPLADELSTCQESWLNRQILPQLQPLVVMQVPFWTALGVHVTSGLLYPFYPQVRAIVTRQSVQWDKIGRTVAATLGAGLIVLSGLEVLARADREPRWPLKSVQERAFETQFLHHMTAHHAVGVELATLAQSNAGDPRLRRLGRLMVANQAGEIRIIARWWRSWMDGPMPTMSAEERAAIPGMTQPAAITQLAAERGSRFDAAFVPVMIAHHRGAILMADEAWRAAGDPRVCLLADSIRHAQRRQISAMSGIQ